MNLTQALILVPHPWIAVSLTIKLFKSLIIFGKFRFQLVLSTFYFFNFFINNLNLYIGFTLHSDDNVKFCLLVGKGEAALLHVLLAL